MSEITTAIPPQAFERVRDQIALILATELAAQQILTYDEVKVKAVWVERIIPFDKEEVPAVNVSLLRGDPRGQFSFHVDGLYRYAVDCYSKSKATDATPGDRSAMLKLHRLLGVCRAIIEDPKYKTLGIAPPFLGNRHFESLGIADPGKEDATNSVMGRLILVVRIPEKSALEEPVLLYNNTTVVKLDNTELGYVWINPMA